MNTHVIFGYAYDVNILFIGMKPLILLCDVNYG
jgi:hypothetical protein